MDFFSSKDCLKQLEIFKYINLWHWKLHYFGKWVYIHIFQKNCFLDFQNPRIKRNHVFLIFFSIHFWQLLWLDYDLKHLFETPCIIFWKLVSQTSRNSSVKKFVSFCKYSILKNILIKILSNNKQHFSQNQSRFTNFLEKLRKLTKWVKQVNK